MFENANLIPKNMGNDESKLVASIICIQREKAIVDANLNAAINRYKKFKELMPR